MKVFVYGTLQKGYGNHIYLEDANFLGHDKVENFKLYHAGFPVSTPNNGTKITGEVFEVMDEYTIEDLDMLEGYRGEGNSSNMYNREKVVTESGHECFMYVGNSPFWRDFQGMTECHNEDGVFTWKRY